MSLFLSDSLCNNLLYLLISVSFITYCNLYFAASQHAHYAYDNVYIIRNNYIAFKQLRYSS